MDLALARFEIEKIQTETDPVILMVKLSSLIGRVFQERGGYEMVVVGGSAIELYTEGEYMSGDVDMTWKIKRPPLVEIQTVMREMGAIGGPRNFQIAGIFVDLLGPVETEARTPFYVIQGPYGPVNLIQPEQLLCERILVAKGWPSPDEKALKCAQVLMLACVSGSIRVDWKEAKRVAESPEYQVSHLFEEIKLEMTRQWEANSANLPNHEECK